MLAPRQRSAQVRKSLARTAGCNSLASPAQPHAVRLGAVGHAAADGRAGGDVVHLLHLDHLHQQAAALRPRLRLPVLHDGVQQRVPRTARAPGWQAPGRSRQAQASSATHTCGPRPGQAIVSVVAWAVTRHPRLRQRALAPRTFLRVVRRRRLETLGLGRGRRRGLTLTRTRTRCFPSACARRSTSASRTGASSSSRSGLGLGSGLGFGLARRVRAAFISVALHSSILVRVRVRASPKPDPSPNQDAAVKGDRDEGGPNPPG